MSPNQSFIPDSQNIHADLKGPKLNINCTMVDERGDVLQPSHCTTLAAVKANKSILFRCQNSIRSSPKIRDSRF